MALGLDGDALDRCRYVLAAEGFRRLKAHKQLPAYVPLWKHTRTKTHTASLLAKPTPLNINLGSDRFAMFNKVRDIPLTSAQLRTSSVVAAYTWVAKSAFRYAIVGISQTRQLGGFVDHPDR